MKIEIEKKYDLTLSDSERIKEKCTFISDSSIQDYYLDDNDFTLFKNNYKLRLRNGKYELKIKAVIDSTAASRSIEIDDEEKIEEQLKKFNLSTDTVTGVLEIHTQIKKYKYDFKNHEFIIDIQKYKYNDRYEVELLLDDDTNVDANNLIDNFRSHIWLVSREQESIEGKIICCAMHENIPLYEVILNIKL